MNEMTIYAFELNQGGIHKVGVFQGQPSVSAANQRLREHCTRHNVAREAFASHPRLWRVRLRGPEDKTLVNRFLKARLAEHTSSVIGRPHINSEFYHCTRDAVAAIVRKTLREYTVETGVLQSEDNTAPHQGQHPRPNLRAVA
jgi:hypothetical protein